MLKFDICNEDNQREACKIIGDVNVVQFLYPNLKKSGFSLKCFVSNWRRDSKTEEEMLDPSAKAKIESSLEMFLKDFNGEEYEAVRKNIQLNCQKIFLNNPDTAITNQNVFYF